MKNLDKDQEARRATNQKTAIIWGGMCAAIVGFIAFWALSNQSVGLHFGGTAVFALAAGYNVYRWSYRMSRNSS